METEWDPEPILANRRRK